MLKAALHVHSTYSDGELTLQELRDKFIAAGCGVVAMADHSDAFDEQLVQQYVSECRRLSDEKLLFVPGIEFSCVHRIHIVGFGVTSLVSSDDPATVIAHIRREGGVAVIAHPPDALFDFIAALDILPDGIEGWNSKYDGRYAPRPSTFALIRSLQRRAPSIRAFYGQDLHWRKQFAGLFCWLDIPRAERALVLQALVRGAFEGAKDSRRFPSDAHLPPAMLEEFGRVNARSRRFRSIVKSVRTLMGRSIDHLPSAIKGQIRRLF
jgi:hypothetical protein